MGVGVVLRQFEAPDKCRKMKLGRFEIVRLGGMSIGRVTYQPGWQWSVHVGPELGAVAVPGSAPGARNLG